MGKMKIRESKHRTVLSYTHAWALIMAVFGRSSHECLQPWSEKKLVSERTEMIWRRSELGVLLLIAPEMYKLWATSNLSAWRYPWYELSLCSACLLGELTEKKEKEIPQCCYGITWAGCTITLAKPGYQSDVLFAGTSRAAGQWGMEKWETEQSGHCRGTWMTERVSQGLYPDTRPGTASSGTFVSWTIPLVFPSMLCWPCFKSLRKKSLFFSSSVEQGRESSSRHCSQSH